MISTQEVLDLAFVVGEGTMIQHGSQPPLHKRVELALLELLAERQNVERVQAHIALAIQFIEARYPDARLLDSGPMMKNLRKWRDKLDLGQPKGALHDDIIKYRKLCKAFDGMKTSTSERFLECLGIYDADVCLPFDELWRPT